MRGDKRNKGFSLIEVMVTMAIVALAASIAYPSFVETIRKARRADATTTLLDLHLAQEKYRANNPTYAANLADLGMTSASNEGYYTVAIAAAAANSFSATASPAAGTAQASDSCTFTLTQEGPDVSTSTKRSCWNK